MNNTKKYVLLLSFGADTRLVGLFIKQFKEIFFFILHSHNVKNACFGFFCVYTNDAVERDFDDTTGKVGTFNVCAWNYKQ